MEGTRVMDSSLIRKIEKAKGYAMQPDRVEITQYQARFRGDNGDHLITYQAGSWNCSCNYFSGHGTCSHTMAMHTLLEDMGSKEPASVP